MKFTDGYWRPSRPGSSTFRVQRSDGRTTVTRMVGDGPWSDVLDGETSDVLGEQWRH